MAEPFIPKFVDLVRNFTTTQGTGNFGLGAAVPGHSSLAGKVAPGDRFYYCAIGIDKPGEREVGRGTMLANGTVAREPVSGALTNFTGGIKTIALVVGAEWFSEAAKALRAEALIPERFGAKGDGLTNDTVAFQALTAAVNAAGGGTIELRPGATYLVGRQTFGAARTSGTFTSYTGVPELLMEFVNCTKPITIRGNGARIRIAPGKYGTFDASGTATTNTLPYYGPQIAAHYRDVIRVENCSGFVLIDRVEIDGASNDAILGGPWGDTGYQLGGVGIRLANHRGGGLIRGVNSHHHTSDGMVIDGIAASEAATTDQIRVESCNFDYNGRLGIAIVGGRGYHFHGCTSNWNANQAITGGAPLTSPPASGLDLEAEGGKIIRDCSFTACDFIGNLNTQMVADSGTPVDRIDFLICRFVQTSANSYCVWPNRPGLRFEKCLFAGTVVSLWLNPLNPSENPRFNQCLFSNSNEFSPTGVTGCVNNLVVDSPGVGAVFRRSTFDFNRPGVSANFNMDGPRLEDCTIVARDGYPAVNGRYAGKTEFIQTGSASIQALPGGETFVAFKVDCGHSEWAWAFTTGGVRTVYPATIDGTREKPVYQASATYNPPSLAAGAKSVIQTMAVTGAALGDKVTELSFLIDLAGARIHAWVSAANTVSFYAVNDNGANPLDLGAGTLRVRVVKA